jgi:hypothetical protein
VGESDMTTKKHPRTLQEAFGPYTSEYVYDEDDECISWWWWAVWAVLTIGAGVLIWL